MVSTQLDCGCAGQCPSFIQMDLSRLRRFAARSDRLSAEVRANQIRVDGAFGRAAVLLWIVGCCLATTRSANCQPSAPRTDSPLVGLCGPPDLGSTVSPPPGYGACAANSLYVLLRLFEYDVDYAQIASMLPSTFDGVTLLQLKQCATELGVPCTLRRREPERLLDAPFPAVYHGHFGVGRAGHYIVVLSVESDRAKYIDGTTGEIQDVRTNWLRERLTGFCLYTEPNRSSSLLVLWLLPIGASVAVFLRCLARGFSDRRYTPADTQQGR